MRPTLLTKLFLAGLFLSLPSLAHATTYYFCTSAGTGWSTGANWTTVMADQASCAASGTAPTASDTAIINSSSGNIALDSATADVAGTVTMTGYTGTLTLTAADILIVSGSVTLGGTITGTGTLKINGVSTITTNSISWPGALNLAEAGAVTIANGGALWAITGLCTISAAVNLTPNAAGDGLNCSGGLTLSATMNASSTAAIQLSGGTWQGAFFVYGTLTISGNITISGSVIFAGSSITYSSGTVIQSSSPVLALTTAATGMAVNIGGVTWTNLYISPTTASTITLSSNINATNIYLQFSTGGNRTLTFSGNYVFNITNFYAGIFNVSALATLIWKFAPGQILNISNSIYITSPTPVSYFNSVSNIVSAGDPATLQSSTANSPFYINYQGSLQNEHISDGIVFTDVQSVGRILYNINGGTLTRTTGIINKTTSNFIGNKTQYEGI